MIFISELTSTVPQGGYGEYTYQVSPFRIVSKFLRMAFAPFATFSGLPQTGASRRRSTLMDLHKGVPHYRSSQRSSTILGLHKGVPQYWVFTKAFPTTGSSQRCSGTTWSCLGLLTWLPVSHCQTIRRLPCLLGGHASVWFGLVWSTRPAVQRSHKVC